MSDHEVKGDVSPMADIPHDSPAFPLVQVPVSIHNLVTNDRPIDHERSRLSGQRLFQSHNQAALGSIESEKDLGLGVLSHRGRKPIELGS